MSVSFTLPGDPAQRTARAEALEPIVVRSAAAMLLRAQRYRFSGAIPKDEGERQWEQHRALTARVLYQRLSGFVGRWYR